MSGRNWDRPSFKIRRRLTESLSGADVPEQFRTTPPRLPRPKADMRRDAEAAVREFIKRQSLKDQPPSPIDKPPWED
jgi:hypothetical protein